VRICTHSAPALGPTTTSGEVTNVGDTFRRLEADVANALVMLKPATDAEVDPAIEQVQRSVAERNA
jgi:phosphohistidine swiveling domain-containing protein